MLRNNQRQEVLVIWALIIILGSVYVVLPAYEDGNKITGYVLSRDEQLQLVCGIANAHNLPGSIMLTVANIESTLNHWGSDESIVTNYNAHDNSLDVGIMQIRIGNLRQLPAGSVPCPEDGSLNVKDIEDNIECGMLTFKDKCSFVRRLTGINVDCNNGEVHYCCPNDHSGNYFSTTYNRHFPISTVGGCSSPYQYYQTYSGWDVAIKGYNGWACGPSEANRRYVETFHANEEQFRGICGDAVWTGGGKGWTMLQPPEIPDRAIGLYGIMPSFEFKLDYDIEDYEQLVEIGKEFVEDVKEARETECFYWQLAIKLGEGDEYPWPGLDKNVIENQPDAWYLNEFELSEDPLGGYFAFSFGSGYEFPFYDEIDDENVIDKMVVYSYAIFFEDIICPRPVVNVPDPEPAPECADICSVWSYDNSCCSSSKRGVTRSCPSGSGCGTTDCWTCGSGFYCKDDGVCWRLE